MCADDFHALSAEDQHVFHSATAFVKERLDDVAMLEWALKLDRYKLAERLAVRSLFEYPMTAGVKEPWLSAWRWLIEMWARPGSQAVVVSASMKFSAESNRGSERRDWRRRSWTS